MLKYIGTVDSEIMRLTEEGEAGRKYFENVAIQNNTVITVIPAASDSQAYAVTDPFTGETSEEFFETELETYISVEQITLKENKIKMTSGSKRLLTVNILPDNATDKKMIWNSSNEEIAEVDSDGVVTAKAEGKCTIQCTAVSESSCYSTAEIEVLTDQSGCDDSSNTGNQGSGNEKPPEQVTDTKIKVSGIRLSGLSKRIAAGKKIKLTANVFPSNASNKKVTWRSGNTKIATVDSTGLVTIKKGSGGKKVTITASAADGSGKKASYKLTSMKGVVKKVAISGKKTKAVKAGKPLRLKAKVTASNAKKANRKLKWTSGNTKYVTVSSTGKIRTKKAGKGKKVKITAMATDGSGKKTTVTIKMK